MRLLKSIPLAVSGVALALAALGNLLLPYGAAVRYMCGAAAAAILVLFLLKLVFDGKNVAQELKNPLLLSILPTSSMALMLLCTYILPFIGTAAVYLWYAAIAAQLLIMAVFAARFALGFKLQTVLPSWFVVCVGIVVASVTAPAMGAAIVGRVAFYLGLALYVVALALVIIRMVKLGPLPEPARPTIAIFTAPMSLCLAGYLSSFEEPNPVLTYAMLIVAIICYIYVTISMIGLLRIKFYPTYAAFTFPYVISAVAFKSANAFLLKNGYTFFSLVPKIAQWIAILAVAYVVVRYLAFIVSALRAKPEAA